MFDGSVGAAWRGDALGETSGDGSVTGVSPSSSAYYSTGNAEHGEGERRVYTDATVAATTAKGSSGEMRKDDPAVVMSRGNAGMVNNGNNSSSSGTSVVRLRSRV